VANPVVDSATFDQASYARGSVITATVRYHGANVTDQSDQFTGTVTDRVTGESGQGTGTLNVAFANLLDASGSDASGRQWDVQSDDHAGTAVLTSVA
jgi:hypothetical protein